MHRTGRYARLLPLFGTLVLATAGLQGSAHAESHRATGRIMGLADIQAPAPIAEDNAAAPQPANLAAADIPEDSTGPVEESGQDIGIGMASYYGNELAGRRTASGEVFNPRALTAAHRTLPFGSKVRITNPRSGKSVIVRINDRGPFSRGRVLDMSEAAAREIGIAAMGHGQVKLALLSR